MNFEFDNNMPIYIQLVEQLKNYIIAGKLSPGERLLSVRELALKSKVNPNTMQRALAELENMELVYTERTSGRYVTKDIDLINKYKEEYAKDMAEKFFTSMESLGFNKEQSIEYILRLGGKE